VNCKTTEKVVAKNSHSVKFALDLIWKQVRSESFSFFLSQSRDCANYICKTEFLSVNEPLSDLVCQKE